MNGKATETFSTRALEGEGVGKRALVTGLHGFTGYYVARELTRAGYRVFGTVMPGAETGPDIFTVDLCDRESVIRAVEEVQPDVVVHLAGIAFVAHSNADLIYRVNIVGTRNLLEALAGARHQASSVLLASSANIYGHVDLPVIDESIAPAPFNDYGVSKLAMEHMAQLWSDKLPIIIVRPFNYTGVGQDINFLLPKIVSHFRAGAREIELGNLDVARDFSDVRMVARAYRRLLALSPPGQIYNVCSGRADSLAGIIDTMSAIAGYSIDVRVNPAFVRPREVQVMVGSNRKLAGIIGELEPTPLADTLRWMYQA
ncbi:NAD-dependent epimerase/dehydratase family protein [Massilia cavernae]|uniref:NAD-dependent epimerase/dehydratase family protein n=1 Tax=Massilia cavernae TaxID=2320864 RepID=A0A418XRW2_9BURK|nr:NAD-dependent epimerase/dehydratase family protein [Massilia cavernae]RJG15277.1 NAD-dependent epimerase/dehydratase family protein [Massilia cavernae]